MVLNILEPRAKANTQGFWTHDGSHNVFEACEHTAAIQQQDLSTKIGTKDPPG